MIDALYRVPDTFDDQSGGVTLPNLRDAGWLRTQALQVPGSRASGNFFMVHALLNDGLTAQEIQDLVAGDCLGALAQDGTVIIPLNEATIIDFLADLDDQGTRPTDISTLHQYAGRAWDRGSLDSGP